MTMLPAEKLELRPRMQQQSTNNPKHIIWVGVVLLTVFPLLFIASLLKKHGGTEKDWGALWGMLWKQIEANPAQVGFNVLVLCLVVIHAIFLLAFQKRERLVLTRNGIEYHSPLPPWLQFLRSNWTLSWNQVRALSLRSAFAGHALQRVVLELATVTGKRQLIPFYWVDPATYQAVSPWKLAMQLKRYSAEGMAAEIESSPLMQYVQAMLPNVPVKRADNLFNTAFAIEKNPASLAVTAVFMLLLAYAILDGGFLMQEIYVQTPPYEVFGLIGIAAAVGAWMWMWRGGVPVAEGLVIALLTGSGVGMACYPGALRFNALTDTEGLRAYHYALSAGREFLPLQEGPPALHFDGYPEYWSQFRPGSEYVFELRRGGLGFFQLNMDPVKAEMRSFYIKSRQK